MKKKLFENIGDNVFKLRKDLSKNEGFDATGEEIDAKIILFNPKTELEEDVDVIVTYTYYEPIRGSRDEPDAEESIEITSVKRQDNNEEIINSLSDAEITELEKHIKSHGYSYDPD
jgi:hypothetical protein